MEGGSSIRYPKSVKVDFNRLERHALMKLLKHYGVVPKVGTTHPELASMVARSFDSMPIAENEVLSKFSDKKGNGSSDFSSKRPKYSREYLDNEPAKVGEQVLSILPLI